MSSDCPEQGKPIICVQGRCESIRLTEAVNTVNTVGSGLTVWVAFAASASIGTTGNLTAMGMKTVQNSRAMAGTTPDVTEAISGSAKGPQLPALVIEGGFLSSPL